MRPESTSWQLHNVSVSLSGLQEAQVAGFAQEIADRQGGLIQPPNVIELLFKR